jgi:hypothetical protein
MIREAKEQGSEPPSTSHQLPAIAPLLSFSPSMVASKPAQALEPPQAEHKREGGESRGAEGDHLPDGPAVLESARNMTTSLITMLVSLVRWPCHWRRMSL